MKKLLFLLLPFLLGCSAQFHLRQAIKKDPHLFDTLTVRRDTVRLPVPEIHYVDKLIYGDTVTVYHTDTVTKGITKIQYIVKKDTTGQGRDSISFNVKPQDTQVITEVKTVLVEKPLTKQIKNKYRKQGAVGLIIIVALIVIAVKTRKLWLPLITGGWSKILTLFKPK